MTTGKTFEAGEVLTADDVNTYLNPSTAPNLIRDAAAGSVSFTVPAGATYANAPTVTINFPAGRFDAAPAAVLVNVRQALTSWPFVAMVRSKTATSAVVQISWESSYSVSSNMTMQLEWLAVAL